MKRQPTVAEIIMFAGGAITFIFSFLPFIGNGESRSAWGSFFALFPNTTVIALLGLAMAVFVALDVIIGFKLPTFLTFTPKQIYVTWGVVAGGFMLCYLITDKVGADSKPGLYLMLIGSLAMAVGSILNILNLANQPVGTPASSAPSAPSAPSATRPPAPPPPSASAPSAPPPPPPGPATPPTPPPSSGPPPPPPPPPRS